MPDFYTTHNKRLKAIRSILSGLEVSVEQKRQAWIDYGEMLAQCPYTQGAQIGAWVRQQGLDFVPRNQDRADAKNLFNITEVCNVNLSNCPHSHPVDVLTWLRKTGQIEFTPRVKSEADDQPETDAEGAEDLSFYGQTVALRNAARQFVNKQLSDLDPDLTEQTVLDIAQMPAGVTWAACPSGRAIGLTFRVVVEANYFDVAQDEQGNQTYVKAEPTSLGQFARSKGISGLTPAGEKIALSLKG